LELLRGLQSRNPLQFDVIRLATNQGKAEAVRRGVLHSLKQRPFAVGFWDADLATPLDAIPRMLEILNRRENVDFVFGSRMRLLGRRIKRKPWRQKLGGLFSFVASRVLGMNVKDTQCGAKLIRNTALTRKIFNDRFLSGWIFDVELFARWRCCVGHGHHESIYEFPLEDWQDVEGSKLRAIDFITAVVRLMGIFWRYNVRGWQPSALHVDPVLTLPQPQMKSKIYAGKTSARAA
jgi:glycosyltransferase involved in cell wall biosynthesis